MVAKAVVAVTGGTFARGAAVKPAPVWNGQRMERDGMVAVVVNGSYGAGWSTEAYTDEERLMMAFHPELVTIVEYWRDLILEERKVTRDYYSGKALREGMTYNARGWHERWVRGLNVYRFSGVSPLDLRVEWVRKGREFTIEVHDGCESLVFKDAVKWEVA